MCRWNAQEVYNFKLSLTKHLKTIPMKITDNYNYLEPAPIWSLLGIGSFDQYIQRYLVKGRFHEKVPMDVVKEFKTIEHLIAYSYFYSPMLDMAFLKATLVVEMAVRIRCAQLNIEVSHREYISLNSLLKKLASHVHPSIPSEWYKVKAIRNHLAHPEQSSLLGATVLNAFSQIVNIINKLFLSVDYFNNLEEQTSQLQKKLKYFALGLFVLEHNDIKYLISSAKPYLSFKPFDKEISFWGFHQICENFPQSLNDRIPVPLICLPLKNILFEGETLTASMLNSKQQIKVYKTENPIDQATYAHFKTKQNLAEPGVLELYLNFVEQELSKRKENFIYEEFWIRKNTI